MPDFERSGRSSLHSPHSKHAQQQEELRQSFSNMLKHSGLDSFMGLHNSDQDFFEMKDINVCKEMLEKYQTTPAGAQQKECAQKLYQTFSDLIAKKGNRASLHDLNHHFQGDERLAQVRKELNLDEVDDEESKMTSAECSIDYSCAQDSTMSDASAYQRGLKLLKLGANPLGIGLNDETSFVDDGTYSVEEGQEEDLSPSKPSAKDDQYFRQRRAQALHESRNKMTPINETPQRRARRAPSPRVRNSRIMMTPLQEQRSKSASKSRARTPSRRSRSVTRSPSRSPRAATGSSLDVSKSSVHSSKSAKELSLQRRSFDYYSTRPADRRSEAKSPRQRERSQSPRVQHKSPHRRERSQSPSHKSPRRRDMSQSPSLQHKSPRQRERSQSPSLQHKSPHRRERSQSPGLQHKSPRRRERSQSPSLQHKSPRRRERSQSPSLQHKSPRRRERSQSPSLQHKSPRRRERSQSPSFQHKSPRRQAGSQSPSSSEYKSPRRQAQSPRPDYRQTRSQSPRLENKSPCKQTSSQSLRLEYKSPRRQARSQSPTSSEYNFPRMKARSQSPSLEFKSPRRRARSQSPGAQYDSPQKEARRRTRSRSPTTPSRRRNREEEDGPIQSPEDFPARPAPERHTRSPSKQRKSGHRRYAGDTDSPMSAQDDKNNRERYTSPRKHRKSSHGRPGSIDVDTPLDLSLEDEMCDKEPRTRSPTKSRKSTGRRSAGDTSVDSSVHVFVAGVNDDQQSNRSRLSRSRRFGTTESDSPNVDESVADPGERSAWSARKSPLRHSRGNSRPLSGSDAMINGNGDRSDNSPGESARKSPGRSRHSTRRSGSSDDIIPFSSGRNRARRTPKEGSRHSVESLESFSAMSIASESMDSGTEHSSAQSSDDLLRISSRGRSRPEGRGRESSDEGIQRRSRSTGPPRRSQADNPGTSKRSKTPSRSNIREPTTPKIFKVTRADELAAIRTKKIAPSTPNPTSRPSAGMARVKELYSRKTRSSSAPRQGRRTDFTEERQRSSVRQERGGQKFSSTLEELEMLCKSLNDAKGDDGDSVQTWEMDPFKAPKMKTKTVPSRTQTATTGSGLESRKQNTTRRRRVDRRPILDKVVGASEAPVST